jgi:threonine dehydratase
MTETRITLRDLYRARAAIAGVAARTPLVPAWALSGRLGREVLYKLETLQPTGAFKLRGAVNRIAALGDDERARGVVTVSTGNHGRAVAYAARRQGLRAVVCLSCLVPRNKVEAIERLGALVRIHGNSQDEAEEEAGRLVAEDGMVYVSPFDDAHVIAGQGTIGLELLEDLPEQGTVLVPLSGGGLIAGIALALKAADPAIRVVGISMERGAAMHASLAAGHPVAVEEVPTLADSLGGGIGQGNRYTFRLVRDLVDEVVLLSEDEIARGMAFAYLQERLVLEGGAAVGIAALLAGKVTPGEGRICCVVTGNNVDMDVLGRVVADARPSLEEGAWGSGRSGS